MLRTNRLKKKLRAAQASDTAMLLRVPSHDPVYIMRALDAGVDGIVVPTVETAEEARAVVAATRYRPQGGNRGVGYPESRAAPGFYAKGYDFVTLTADIWLLADGAKRALEEAKLV